MKRNILIVEDDHVMRHVIKRTIAEIGIEAKQLYEAFNGEQGLEILKCNKIDLMFTDINMPIMDGLEMLAHVRDNVGLRHIPAVVISSEKDKRVVDALVESGLGYVHKPFTIQTLEDQITKLEIDAYGWAE